MGERPGVFARPSLLQCIESPFSRVNISKRSVSGMSLGCYDDKPMLSEVPLMVGRNSASMPSIFALSKVVPMLRRRFWEIPSLLSPFDTPFRTGFILLDSTSWSCLAAPQIMRFVLLDFRFPR